MNISSKNIFRCFCTYLVLTLAVLRCEAQTSGLPLKDNEKVTFIFHSGFDGDTPASLKIDNSLVRKTRPRTNAQLTFAESFAIPLGLNVSTIDIQLKVGDTTADFPKYSLAQGRYIQIDYDPVAKKVTVSQSMEAPGYLK